MAYRLVLGVASVMCAGAALAATGAEVLLTLAESRFGRQVPAGWQMGPGWALSDAGARAQDVCRATWDQDLPESCRVEMVFSLPEPAGEAKPATASMAIGAPRERITAALHLGPNAYQATLTAPRPGSDGKPVSSSAGGDTRPSVLRAWKETDQHTGWAGHVLSLGLEIEREACRLLVNGSVAATVPARLSGARGINLSASGVLLRSVRILPAIGERHVALGGLALARLNGGESAAPAAGVTSLAGETVYLQVDGVPLAAQGAEAGGLATLAVSAERWKPGDWSEGTGMPTVPVPLIPYSAAHVLLYLPPGEPGVPAMGFGLRVPEMSAADLKNVYVAPAPVRSSDEGVRVRPVPALGPGWSMARVPLNPAALHWYTHDAQGRLLPPEAASKVAAYLTRPWTAGAGTPHPEGKPSALRVAAVTLERAGVDLWVQGNALGNVTCEPGTPRLTATLHNLTPSAVVVQVATTLVPFGRPAATRRRQVRLRPGETATLDALAQPVRERGHYRVAVAADAGVAGRSEWRTNVALLAPDTRKKANSPFGCWSVLWTDGATEAQRTHLKEKAGIAFIMGKHHYDHRMATPVPDDAAAEAIIRKMGSDVRVVMLGWEQQWSMEQTFAFPRVIAEGRPEALPDEVAEKVGQTVAEWRRLAQAVRRLRPDLKISLGNSAVNFTVPFLERGFRHGVEFDYFGTEEGLFDAAPEQPADAIGNISWWARAVCEHFGFRKVPLFHSETVYLATGPAFSRMAERSQAAHYVRTYLLGYPYDSLFAFSGAMVDSSNSYIYSLWGMSGYCNQAAECSPKLSYVAYATLTQLLDGARWEGKLDTGTTSLYALRFRQPDGAPLTAIWNLRGARRVVAELAPGGTPTVVDALNRPVDAVVEGRSLALVASDLPLYVRGAEIRRLIPGANMPDALPKRRLLSSLEDLPRWTVDAAPDVAFEAPREWRGMPKALGQFEVAFEPDIAPPGVRGRGAATFTQKPLPGKHGLIPRYVSLSAPEGKVVPIPAGTTQLGVWVRGNSTWAQVKLGVEDAAGKQWLILDEDSAGRMVDNFDGWRLLRTGPLGCEVAQGGCKVRRLVVTMPEQQVYVDEVRATARPQIAVWGLYAMGAKPDAVCYLPW